MSRVDPSDLVSELLSTGRDPSIDELDDLSTQLWAEVYGGLVSDWHGRPDALRRRLQQKRESVDALLDILLAMVVLSPHDPGASFNAGCLLRDLGRSGEAAPLLVHAALLLRNAAESDPSEEGDEDNAWDFASESALSESRLLTAYVTVMRSPQESTRTQRLREMEGALRARKKRGE